MLGLNHPLLDHTSPVFVRWLLPLTIASPFPGLYPHLSVDYLPEGSSPVAMDYRQVQVWIADREKSSEVRLEGVNMEVLLQSALGEAAAAMLVIPLV